MPEERSKIMDNLIAQDADLIVLDDPGFNKPANTLVRDMSRAIHKVLSKDNIDAYLMMSRDVAGDAARSVLPFIKADRIEALEAENERLLEALAKCVAVQIFPDGKGGHKVSASFDNYKAANPLFSLLTRYISDDHPALRDTK